MNCLGSEVQPRFQDRYQGRHDRRSGPHRRDEAGGLIGAWRRCSPPIARNGGAGLRRIARARQEIWLVFYKKASGKQTVSYDHAVEEALCFGWVDGMKKGLDDECYAFRFTPRKAEERVVEVEYRACGAADRGGQNDARGTKGVPLGRSPGSCADARRDAESIGSESFGNSAPLGQTTEISAGLPSRNGGMGGQRKEGRDALKRLEKLIEFSARNNASSSYNANGMRTQECVRHGIM